MQFIHSSEEGDKSHVAKTIKSMKSILEPLDKLIRSIRSGINSTLT